MPGNSVIIADSRIAARKGLKNILNARGYRVVAEAANIPDVLRKARTHYPDLVLLDDGLPGGTISEAAGILEDDVTTQVLVLVSENYFSHFDNFAYIKKPYSDEALLSAIEISLYYKQKLQSIQNEVGKLHDSINKRKSVDQAKGLLMQKYGMDEASAYRYIQKISMDRSKPMKEVAQDILHEEEANKSK